MENITTHLENHNNSACFYGGELHIDDFSTELPNPERVNNDKDTDSLNESIKNQAEIRKYYGMTYEKLKNLKLISNTDGRPVDYLTDKLWQTEFKIRKSFVKPSIKSYMGGKYSRESGYWNEETQGKYYGATNYQEYCAFINDILRNIRSGQIDYCYFIYQIMDLLRYEYDRLVTKYCDGYWEVWLKK